MELNVELRNDLRRGCSQGCYGMATSATGKMAIVRKIEQEGDDASTPHIDSVIELYNVLGHDAVVFEAV